MNILYVATDQTVPGTTGGSTHVRAVAEGLAALGHTVHVSAEPGPGGFPANSPVTWHLLGPVLGLRQFRWLRARRVEALARDANADVIVERYYNFGGEGMLAAARIGAKAVLEVNAPIVDHPGSAKRALDLMTIVQPMRRWREWQCRAAHLIVTPTAQIVPESARDRVLELEWGADTDRFRPDATGPAPFTREPGDVVALFVGAFRPWHGAIALVRAIAQLRSHGDTRMKAVFIGDGPELPRVRAAANGIGGLSFAGALPHDRVPAAMAAADIGVAPFDVAAHAPLSIEFYWSPLKVFEYMASGLPVVAPDIPRLRELVRHDEEGLLYNPADPAALSVALLRLAAVGERTRLGRAARARAVGEFSWRAHCEKLDVALRKLV